jgi:nitrile hydratase accessory protein
LKPSDLPGIPLDDDGPVFAEPWEAQAFAMAVKLNERGLFTWSEWATALGAAIAANPDEPYYENWLAALESLVEAKGLMSHAEREERIDAWDRAAKATPHGQPIELSRSSGKS